MKILPIKENRKDYIAAGALGIIGGCSLKSYLPLSEYEKSEYFTPDVMRALKKTEHAARETEYDAILVGVKEGSEEIAEDVLNVFKENKTSIVGNKFSELLENIKGYDRGVQDGVLKLSERVRISGKDARKVDAKAVKSLARSARPTSFFVLATSVILLSLAVLKNSLSKNMDIENEPKPLDYKA